MELENKKASEMKKVLVISSRPPYPLYNGSAIRTYQMMEYLSHYYQIDLLYMTEDVNDSVQEGLQSCCRKIIRFRINKLRSYFKVLKGLFFTKKPLQVSYYHYCKVQKWVNKHAHDYDMIFCNNIRTAEYVRKLNKPKMIDYVDAISMNYAKAVNMKKGVWHYIYKIDCKRCLKYEQKLLHEFDKHFIISDIDKSYILKNSDSPKDIYVVENYVANNGNIFVQQKEHKTIVFVGTMNYEPNVTAVKYFVNRILPGLREQFNDIAFYIVGNKPSHEVQKLHNGKDVIVTGFVEDVKKFIAEASIVVVPMRSGAGIQNKILEAMAMRGCVVTTSIGAEGLQHLNGELVIADSEKEMINQITRLLDNIDDRKAMGIAAETYIRIYYSKETMLEKFKEYLLN